MLQIYYVASNIATTDQTVHVYACGIHSNRFLSPKEAKNGSKKKWKHLYLKRDTFFLQENVCLTLLPKNAHGITQRPTLIPGQAIIFYRVSVVV